MPDTRGRNNKLTHKYYVLRVTCHDRPAHNQCQRPYENITTESCWEEIVLIELCGSRDGEIKGRKSIRVHTVPLDAGAPAHFGTEAPPPQLSITCNDGRGRKLYLAEGTGWYHVFLFAGKQYSLECTHPFQAIFKPLSEPEFLWQLQRQQNNDDTKRPSSSHAAAAAGGYQGQHVPDGNPRPLASPLPIENPNSWIDDVNGILQPVQLSPGSGGSAPAAEAPPPAVEAALAASAAAAGHPFHRPVSPHRMNGANAHANSFTFSLEEVRVWLENQRGLPGMEIRQSGEEILNAIRVGVQELRTAEDMLDQVT